MPPRGAARAVSVEIGNPRRPQLSDRRSVEEDIDGVIGAGKMPAFQDHLTSAESPGERRCCFLHVIDRVDFASEKIPGFGQIRGGDPGEWEEPAPGKARSPIRRAGGLLMWPP